MKKYTWIIIVIIVAIAGFLIYRWYKNRKPPSTTATTAATAATNNTNVVTQITGQTTGVNIGNAKVKFEGTPGIAITLDGSVPLGNIPITVEISPGAHTYSFSDSEGNINYGSFMAAADEENIITINL